MADTNCWIVVRVCGHRVRVRRPHCIQAYWTVIHYAFFSELMTLSNYVLEWCPHLYLVHQFMQSTEDEEFAIIRCSQQINAMHGVPRLHQKLSVLLIWWVCDVHLLWAHTLRNMYLWCECAGNYFHHRKRTPRKHVASKQRYNEEDYQGIVSVRNQINEKFHCFICYAIGHGKVFIRKIDNSV